VVRKPAAHNYNRGADHHTGNFASNHRYRHAIPDVCGCRHADYDFPVPYFDQQMLGALIKDLL
jgi:hypothetical protein